MTRRKIEYWVIPPQADAEFVAHMEQVLDTYAQAYDPACPVVCMDEQPVQLVRETRPPIAATRERPCRVDYEYERAGTASVFLFSEPLAGWRQATARARRTKADWALEVAGLLEGRYADCPQVTLVCDNLNTHTKGAFYEVFEPTRARELVRRIEFCYTPKHGSWLNIAENELSSLTRQCLHGRRIGDLGTLHDTALKHDRPLQLFRLPVRRNLAQPLEAGVLHGDVRVEAPGDGAGDEGGAFFLKQLDQPLLPRHQRIDLRRLAVEEVGDGTLVVWRRHRYANGTEDRAVQIPKPSCSRGEEDKLFRATGQFMKYQKNCGMCSAETLRRCMKFE